MQKDLATVLHVIPSLRTGGSENQLAALVTARRKQPLSQIVVSLLSGPEGDSPLTKTIRAAGIPVHQLGGRSPLDLPKILFRLRGLIRRVRPTAIQGWLYYGDIASLWALEMSAHRATTPLYWGIRCSNMNQSYYRLAQGWTIKACAKCSKRPDAVVANSYAGRDAHRALGYSPRAFPVIPNGIDTQRFRPNTSARVSMRMQLGLSEDKLMVIHVGRVDPMKDHTSLVAVAAALPNIHFVAVGSDTNKMAVPPNITTLGIRHDMPNLYPAADLILSTSIFGEGFSNVVAEAMACGVPVVSTDVGDSRRIIGNTGVIVSPRDVAGMFSAIGRIFAEPKTKYTERANAARKRIGDRYSLERMVSTFDALHIHGIPAMPDPH
jgi:glycosyltransferase involved in cell wall biosynthesis